MVNSVRELQVWEKNHLEECVIANLIENKHVLEIGGHTPREHVADLNFKSWTCLDLTIPNICEQPDYCWVNGDVRSLDFEPESFDFIIATHSFEHVNNLDVALDSCYKTLKSGGFLSSLYGPLWSCHNGYHINVIDENNNLIQFNDHDVIPKWAHLLYSKEELSELLAGKYSESLINQMLFQVYDSDRVNRLFYEDYINIINNSGFKILELRNWHKPIYPDKETQQVLEKKYNRTNFGSISTKILLQKP